jgi:hypothetical protein
MNKLPLAVLLVSIMAIGAVALGAGPAPTAGLFTDANPNGSALSTDTMQPATGLTAVASATPGQIDLSWTASASTYTAGYDIYRATVTGGPYALVTSVVGRLTTTYPDTGLTSSQAYFYVVQATYQNWTSAYSNEATDTAP